MATSLPPVTLKKDIWVDIYAETGIPVGTRIIVQNSGLERAIITESAVKPTSGYGFNPIDPYSFFTNVDSNVGAWAKSSLGTKLQVEVA